MSLDERCSAFDLWLAEHAARSESALGPAATCRSATCATT